MLLLITGIILKIIGYRIVDSKKKYEFKNRTSRGTVEFKSYQYSKNHERQKTWGGFLSHLGNIAIVVAILILAFKFLLIK